MYKRYAMTEISNIVIARLLWHSKCYGFELTISRLLACYGRVNAVPAKIKNQDLSHHMHYIMLRQSGRRPGHVCIQEYLPDWLLICNVHAAAGQDTYISTYIFIDLHMTWIYIAK